jgi:phosphoribosylamine--glycine ligase
MSAFVLTDGKSYVILPEAKDYKRVGEGDTGLNTGGMGCVSPVPFANKSFMNKVEEKIIKPTVNGIKKEGLIYEGFIFFGLMNVGGEPYVIEYNVRLGDPETEVILPRLKSDLMEMLIKSSYKRLADFNIRKDSRTVASVMLVSGGYPEAYEKGKKISIPETDENTICFHAGTSIDDEANVITNGGRVIAVSSYGNNLADALKRSYTVAKKIDFDKKYYRRDIGKDLQTKF